MDFACSMHQPNVFLNGGGTSCRISERLINSKFRYRGFGYSVFNRNVVSKARSIRNIRKSIAYTGCSNSSLVFRGNFDVNLWVSYKYKSLSRNFNDSSKLSRRVTSRCQDNDSLAYIDGNGRNVEFMENGDEISRGESVDGPESNSLGNEEREEKEDVEAPSVDELRELLMNAMKELEVARLNSTMFEEKAQRISEAAIALKDEAANAWNDVNATLNVIQEIVNEECIAKEAVRKATMALSLAEARLRVAVESLQIVKGEDDPPEVSRVDGVKSDDREEDGVLLAAENDIKECQANLENCEAELRQLQSKKEELQKQVDRLNGIAEEAQMNALKAEEEVANIMLLAEQAVAFELEAMQRVNDAEIALQRAEKSISNSSVDFSKTKGYVSGDEAAVEEEKTSSTGDVNVERGIDVPSNVDYLVGESSRDILSDKVNQNSELYQSDEMTNQENGKPSLDSPKEAELEAEKSKNVVQIKKHETQKDLTGESSALNAPKALMKKSSRFFSASFFSFAVDGTEFTPASVFQGLIESARKQLPKLVLGSLLFGAGYVPLVLVSLSFCKKCLANVYFINHVMLNII